MALNSASGKWFTRCVRGIGEFFLDQMGYTYNRNCNKLNKLYFAPATLLACYTLISLRALVFKDLMSFAINIIWTAQIVTNALVRHKHLVTKQNEKNQQNQGTGAVVICSNQRGTPWGRRIVIYIVALLLCAVFVLYAIFNGHWEAYGFFSVAAYLIAFIDGGLDVLVGLYDAQES